MPTIEIECRRPPGFKGLGDAFGRRGVVRCSKRGCSCWMEMTHARAETLEHDCPVHGIAVLMRVITGSLSETKYGPPPIPMGSPEGVS